MTALRDELMGEGEGRHDGGENMKAAEMPKSKKNRNGCRWPEQAL